jgi:hypothetical protein
MRQFIYGALITTVVILLDTSVCHAEAALRLGEIRAYLIWEQSGLMSKNVAAARQPIIAIDKRLGTSLQVRVDASIEGASPPLTKFELHMVIRISGNAIFDQTFSDYFIRPRVIRAVIVEHKCGDLDVEVSMGSQRRVTALSFWCGD